MRGSPIWLGLIVGLACAGPAEAPADFTTLAVLDVGLNPHQIAFSGGGDSAFVAAAGSDRLTVVRVADPAVVDTIPVADTPLGVARLPDGGFAATRFGADEIVRLAAGTWAVVDRVTVGGAPSLLAGPLPSGHFLVSVEEADRLWLLNPEPFSLERSFDVGDRPFPPAATSDGRLVFVPNYDDGTVTVIDLASDRVVATTPVGARPSGGVVLPDDRAYAVAVRGEDRVLLLSTETFGVVDTIVEGIGESPFSVVLSPDGRLAFVNNTASHDVSVIDVATRRVIHRIAVGEIPIVMAVHPSGESLWVASEGSHELAIIALPAADGDPSR